MWDNSQWETRIEQLKTQMTGLQQSLNNTQSKNNQLSSDLVSMTNERDNLQTELDTVPELTTLSTQTETTELTTIAIQTENQNLKYQQN